jgi:6-methylsalicylate decarboxylase
MTTIDMHAHFLPDFYRDALVVGLCQADGIAQLPSWDVGAALQAMDRLSIKAAILRSPCQGSISEMTAQRRIFRQWITQSRARANQD